MIFAKIDSLLVLVFHGATVLSGPRLPRLRGFTIILRHITLGTTPLDEWADRTRDIYTHNRQIYMPPAGFEPTIPGSERRQTYALDGAATGTGMKDVYMIRILQKL